jgi:hypothetical protein
MSSATPATGAGARPVAAGEVGQHPATTGPNEHGAPTSPTRGARARQCPRTTTRGAPRGRTTHSNEAVDVMIIPTVVDFPANNGWVIHPDTDLTDHIYAVIDNGVLILETAGTTTAHSPDGHYHTSIPYLQLSTTSLHDLCWTVLRFVGLSGIGDQITITFSASGVERHAE